MKRVIGSAALLLLFALGAVAGERVFCRYVIDGDTFYADGVGKIRLLGVDTPELAREGKPDQPGAVKAKNFLKQTLQGKFALLDYDFERRDKFGRTLAYVTTEEGLDVNEELLKLKLAEPIRHLPYSRKERYLRLWAGAGDKR